MERSEVYERIGATGTTSEVALKAERKPNQKQLTSVYFLKQIE